jgi:tRNA(fMet)-specific endonuclease VapC
LSYLLDTNVVIAFQKRNPAVLTTIRNVPFDRIAISSIVLFELYFGAVKGERTARNIEALGRLPFNALDFTDLDAFEAGKIRDALRRLGTPIGPYDTLIAGQALARDLTLVTRNTREFSRVDGLRVEDWEG